MSSGEEGRCYWVFVRIYSTINTNRDCPNWINKYMEKYILIGIIVFSDSEKEKDCRKPDGHGSNDGIKSSIDGGGGEGQSNIKDLGKSWQKYEK
jgi:hypothetical protein